MGKVKEPAATYYSRPMLNALRNHIKDRIEQMDDAVLLSKISSMLDKDEESFEERYQRAKEFAYTHLDREFAEELEKENFLIGAQPQIVAVFDLDKIVQKADDQICDSDRDDDVRDPSAPARKEKVS